MIVVKKGIKNMHDLVHARCNHCGTYVKFWRGEPDTITDYIGTYDDGERFKVQWTCPICNVNEEAIMIHINPVYDGIYDLIGIEKNRVLTPEEKAEMEAALTIEE